MVSKLNRAHTSDSLARERYFAYSSDNNSVTVTDGSGANAVSQTIYTDNYGNPVLTIAYPAPYTTEFTLNQYDIAENLISVQHESSTYGAITNWATATYSYDGLNRMTSKVDRDYATTTYLYDPMGDLTNCLMPGSLQWQANYNSAGQILQEQNFAGGNPTRTTIYSYFGSGPFAGLLDNRTDGRGTSCGYSYDDWLRPTNIACSGSLPEQNLTTTLQYEPRGFVTRLTEQFANTNTGPTTFISRSFDQYGQLSGESVNVGSFGYSAGQTWDAAGRRTMLGIGGNDYSFGWQADGNLIYASDSTGSGSYTFNTAGNLTSRIVGQKYITINSFDGEGRPLSISTSVSLLPELSESLTWTGDGLLASHTLVENGNFTDSRSYTYANLSRRLTQEQLNLNGSTTFKNTMTYDNGVGGGPGVLTQMGEAGSSSNNWSGATDAFSRIANETNNTSQFPAYGHINGQSILVSGWLDKEPISISAVGTNAMQWQAIMELTPGAHQLTVSALHPSHYFTAWATNYFTNNVAYEATVDTYDSEGDITNRVWKNPSGTVERTQTFSWDARERLHAVTERDANNSGYNWSAVYDALGRRLQTTTILVSNGIASTAPPQFINSYFDPEVEFMELGASYGEQSVWKLYGPDLNGIYGSENGMGGLDAVSPYLNLFNPVVSDARGNILAEVTNGVVSWNLARPTGYGAVPGYRPAAFANGADMAQSSTWRGHEVDITGLYDMGARYYDPISGRFLSFDPIWNAGDPDGYTFCAIGDPINYFDSDGRFGKGFLAARNQPGYMPASATSAFMKGDYYGSFVRGGSQELLKYVDNVWNFALLTVSHPADAPYNPQMDQEFLNDMPFASPMKKWFNVDYGDNSAGNSFVTSIAPLTQNAINSYGVGKTTVSSEEVTPVFFPETQWGAELRPYSYVSPIANANTVASPDTAMRANVNALGTYVNPLTGETVPAQGTLAADHFIPQSWIRSQPGFNTLTANQQDWILNNPANFQGLPQTFNSSKGAQQPDQWTTYKGQPLSQDYIDQQSFRANMLRIQIQQQIDAFNAANQSIYQYNITSHP